MIDYTQTRTDILTGLRDYIRGTHDGLLIIEQNPSAKEPDRPYLTMQLTSPYIPEGQQAIEETELVAHADPAWDWDIEYTRHSNDTMSCSFNIYGENADQAINIGLLAQEWFKFNGLDYLRGKGVVVVECMALQNRETYVVDSWERRQGFDVIFRVLSTVKRVVPTIESADIERT